MHNYDYLEAACRGVLLESVNIATASGHRFVVVGGWSPVLLNNRERLHPGTRDVDLLFEEAVEPRTLGAVVERFLGAGYLVSAKHAFQVLRVVSVGGVQVVLNVDLLHPSETTTEASMFVEHLSLPVPDSEFAKNCLLVKSIMLPNSQFIFDYSRTATVPFSAVLPAGEKMDGSVEVCDEAAILVTKSKSMSMPKRPRDVFDIYVAIMFSRNRAEMTEFFLNELQRSGPEIFNTLFQIAVNVQTDPVGVSERIRKIGGSKVVGEPSRDILSFLGEAGIDVDEAAQKAALEREKSMPFGQNHRRANGPSRTASSSPAGDGDDVC